MATLEKTALGIYSGRWSNVRIRVIRQPMCSTVPSISRSGERIQSPTVNGRSRYTLSPPKKLASKSRAAKPTAIPPIPPNASSPEIEMPIDCSNISVTTAHNIMRPKRAAALIAARSSDSIGPRCSLRSSFSILTTTPCKNQPSNTMTPVSAACRKVLRNASILSKTPSDKYAKRTHSAHSMGLAAARVRTLSQGVCVLSAAWFKRLITH